MYFVNENDVLHNVKIKKYKLQPDYKQIVIASRKIFKSDNWELHCRDRPKNYIPPINTEKKVKTVDKNKNKEVRGDSVKRAKTSIFDIAMQNEFTHFVTWTLDKSKIDREDISVISKKLQDFLKNKVRRNNLKYLLVGEYHKDGQAIHFHGLISGNLKLIDSGHVDKKGNTIYNMPDWKYGFSTAIELYGDKLHTSKYIVKYIQKDFKKIFGKFYFAGGKIERKPEICFDDIDFESVEGKIYKPEFSPCGFKYMDEIILKNEEQTENEVLC